MNRAKRKRKTPRQLDREIADAIASKRRTTHHASRQKLTAHFADHVKRVIGKVTELSEGSWKQRGGAGPWHQEVSSKMDRHGALLWSGVSDKAMDIIQADAREHGMYVRMPDGKPYGDVLEVHPLVIIARAYDPKNPNETGEIAYDTRGRWIFADYHKGNRFGEERVKDELAAIDRAIEMGMTKIVTV